MVNYDLKLVCFNSENWIGNGKLIKVGPLREKFCLKKYDAIFLKNNENNKDIEKIVTDINPNIEIFNTFYEVKNIVNLDLSKKLFNFFGNRKSKRLRKILEKINSKL